MPVSASMLESILLCPAQWFFEREAGRRLGRAPVGQPRPDAARPRRARGPRRAARPEVDAADGRGRGGLGPARLPHARGRASASSPGSARPWAASSQWHLDNPRERPRRRGALPERRRRRRPPGHAHRLRRPARDRRRRPRGRRRLQERPHAAPSGPAVAGNLQLALYQYAVDAGALDEAAGRAVGVRRRRARAARHRRRLARAPRSRASRPTTRRRCPSARSCAPGSPARPRWCAPRTSPRPPARTAATARSSPSARPRAQGA